MWVPGGEYLWRGISENALTWSEALQKPGKENLGVWDCYRLPVVPLVSASWVLTVASTNRGFSYTFSRNSVSVWDKVWGTVLFNCTGDSA